MKFLIKRSLCRREKKNKEVLEHYGKEQLTVYDLVNMLYYIVINVAKVK